MSVKGYRPNIWRYEYRPEPGSRECASCAFAYFDFDLVRYALSIQSDCGNYAYKWCETPDSENFMELMARINDDYLLNKLAKPSRVDTVATIAKLREWIKDGELIEDEDDLEEAMDDLDDRLADFSEDEHEAINREIRDWLDYNEIEIDEWWEIVELDFTPQEKRVVEIFANHIQPQIKIDLKMPDDSFA